MLSFAIFLPLLMSLYTLKPRFQALLRPSARALHGLGMTANQVTVAACAISVGLGAALAAAAQDGHLTWFLLLPVGLLLRMALNAIDGMLAREFAQSSTLGAYLNELCDVISDAVLYLPFGLLPTTAARCSTATGRRPEHRKWPNAAVVLLHRGHEHSGRLQHVVDELGLDDFAMFAWDARGHGHSPGARGDSPSFAALVRDVDSFVRHISSTYNMASRTAASPSSARASAPSWPRPGHTTTHRRSAAWC
jgi:hypothetical protein